MAAAARESDYLVRHSGGSTDRSAASAAARGRDGCSQSSCFWGRFVTVPMQMLAVTSGLLLVIGPVGGAMLADSLFRWFTIYDLVCSPCRRYTLEGIVVAAMVCIVAAVGLVTAASRHPTAMICHGVSSGLLCVVLVSIAAGTFFFAGSKDVPVLMARDWTTAVETRPWDACALQLQYNCTGWSVSCSSNGTASAPPDDGANATQFVSRACPRCNTSSSQGPSVTTSSTNTVTTSTTTPTASTGTTKNNNTTTTGSIRPPATASSTATGTTTTTVVTTTTTAPPAVTTMAPFPANTTALCGDVVQNTIYAFSQWIAIGSAIASVLFFASCACVVAYKCGCVTHPPPQDDGADDNGARGAYVPLLPFETTPSGAGNGRRKSSSRSRLELRDDNTF